MAKKNCPTPEQAVKEIVSHIDTIRGWPVYIVFNNEWGRVGIRGGRPVAAFDLLKFLWNTDREWGNEFARLILPELARRSVVIQELPDQPEHWSGVFGDTDLRKDENSG